MDMFAVRNLCYASAGRYRLLSVWGLLIFAKGVPAQTSSPSPLPDVFAQDARMQQNVRVSAPGLAVKELLARLSQASGVLLTADKTVAEDKVIVFSPARPLQSTLTDLAALFNDAWRREKTSDGKPRYLLTRNPRAVTLEESLLNQSRHRLITQLEAQVTALTETPEQLSKRPSEDPIRKNLSNPEHRMATQVYTALTPAQRELLFSRRYLNFADNAISPQMREPIRNLYTASMRFAARFQREGDGAIKETVEDYARRGVQFAIHTCGGQVLPAVQVYGKGTMHASLFAELDARKQWILPPHGNPYTPSSPPALKSLPDSQQTAKAQAKQHWIDRLQALAELSGKPILADFYRTHAINVVPATETGEETQPVNSPSTQAPRSGTKPPAQKSPPDKSTDSESISALDALCRPVGYLWWTRPDGALLLRKRDWYEQRLYEAPEDWLKETIRRMTAQNNVPTLADFLRARELTMQQILGLNSLHSSEGYSFSEVEAGGTAELLALLDRQLAKSPLLHQPLKRGRVQEGIVKFEGDSLQTARETVQEFLNAQSKPISPSDVQFFRVDAYVVDSTAPEGGFKDAELTLMWSVYNLGVQSQSIRLPFRLPTETQAETEIVLETGSN